MYRTAETLEELDFESELNSFDSVGFAQSTQSALSSIDAKYHNSDYYLIMMNKSEESDIIKFLKENGLTAWLEYDEEYLYVD